MTDYSSWKVADLKAELKKRGIAQTGLRLKQHFIDKLAEEDTNVQPTDTAGPEPESDAKEDRAPQTVPATEEPQTEKPQPEQQPDEPLQPAAPHAQEQLQVEPTPEKALDEDTQPTHLEAQLDEKHDQPPTDTDTQPTEDVEMSEALPDGMKQDPTEPTEEAVEKPDVEKPDVEKPDVEKPTEIPAPQTSEANTELSTPLPVEEALEDKRKRKRRSQSPIPTAEAIANKKARAQEEGPQVCVKDEPQEDTKDTTQEQLPVLTAAEKGLSRPTEQNAQLRGVFASSEAAAAQSSSEGQDVTMEDAIVEPALHSATASLYIDGMMRPMRDAPLRNHLVELATAPGTALDPQVVCEFYLDPIRTHCFVQFAAVAAATRARSKIHGTVWPAESNRKKLRADFIPDQQIKKFIETEEASRNRPGRPVRWEVKYESTDEGVTAVLVDLDSKSESHSKSEPARKVEFNRTPPSGPRGSASQEHRSSNAPPAPPSRPGQGFQPLDQLFESTTAKPKLYYLPVPRKVADKRLDQFDELLRKGPFARRGGDEMRRITFEDEDYFADAGAEYGPRALHRRQARGGRGGDSRRGR